MPLFAALCLQLNLDTFYARTIIFVELSFLRYCGICKEVTKRKSLGFPKRMIKSVANWWWVNVHDDECTAGNEMAPWVKNMTTVTMENTYDELPEFLGNKIWQN